MKSLVIPIIILIATILLNSIIIASPLEPAIMGGEIIESNVFVRPFSRWENRARFHMGEKLVLFYGPDVDNIWVIRLSYSIRHIDLFMPAGDWQTWLTSRVTSIMNNVYPNVMQRAPAGTDSGEYYIGVISSPEFLAELTSALKAQFSARYSGILVMQGITASVEKVTLAEYQASRD